MTNDQPGAPVTQAPKKGFFTKFPGQFWLVIMFEFFERGSYYGMMSFLSQYFVENLGFAKESVGVIKGVIQPLLYFLPILAGAIADRFGYRKVLMVAFTLLGTGYFLTSQVTAYTAVFAALVVMGFGAGTFKPIISGTIAKLTDESNSTQAFGVFYWSINMGAFLFPLILVPMLKSINPAYVIIASGICTASMLIPTALFFKEPAKQKQVEEKAKEREKASLIQTLANAFEIIYSPIVLLFNAMKNSFAWRIAIALILVSFLGVSAFNYVAQPTVEEKYPTIAIEKGDKLITFKVKRDMSAKKDIFEIDAKSTPTIKVTIYKPLYMDDKAIEAFNKELGEKAALSFTGEEIKNFISQSDKKIKMTFSVDNKIDGIFSIEATPNNQYKIILKSLGDYKTYKESLLAGLHRNVVLRGITQKDCDSLVESMNVRPFFLFFVVSVIFIGLFIVSVSMKKSQSAVPGEVKTSRFQVPMMIVPVLIAILWLMPGLTMLGRIISSVIYLSILSLFIIDKSDTHKFVDHSKFLLMIVLYSGFWVLYFQMFDSVLWYLQAYVDAAALNSAVNGFLGMLGIKAKWAFDVEHVVVINGATIIMLQLLISSIVKNKKALPTMITGISIATLGMAVLSLSTQIWVFIIGIMIFSIGEMTAHPKFISYVGLTAPSDRKAMYMGYIFLYGVFGSSVGGVVGSKLYVHFVDNLNQPRTLWLIFSLIGVLTIAGLLLYNKFLAPKKEEAATK